MEADAGFIETEEHDDEEGDHRKEEIHDGGKDVGDREDLVNESRLGQEIVVPHHTREGVRRGIAQ